MKDAKQVCKQIRMFLQWMAIICKEENIDETFLKRFEHTVAMYEKYEAVKGIVPTVVGQTMDNMTRTFFFQSSTSHLGFSMDDVDYTKFKEMLAAIHKLTGRFLEERVTTLSSGRELPESERLFNNLKFIEVVAREEAKEHLQANGATPEQIDEAIKAFSRIELEQLRLVSAAVEEVVAGQDSKLRQASHLTARQKKRRGLSDLKPPASLILPSSGSTSCPDLEQGHSECTSETPSTSQECLSEHE